MTEVPEDDSGLSAAAATRRDVDRVVAFSDGVFAIAITLLVLSLTVPRHVDRDHLGEALTDLVPELISYGLSFLVVGMYWLAHHRVFRNVIKVDRTVLWINLVLLGFVALLPFPTELLGKYGETRLATVIYATAMVAVGGMSVLLWWYLNHAGLTAPISAAQVRAGSYRAAIPPAVFAASIPLALIHPDLAKVFWIAIWPVNVLVDRRFGDGNTYGS